MGLGQLPLPMELSDDLVMIGVSNAHLKSLREGNGHTINSRSLAFMLVGLFCTEAEPKTCPKTSSRILVMRVFCLERRPLPISSGVGLQFLHRGIVRPQDRLAIWSEVLCRKYRRCISNSRSPVR